MTDNEGRGLQHAGQPWSVDLLADLHAGVLDDAEAARLWPAAKADPQAQAILTALDSTRTELSALGQAPPSEPIPDTVAARLDAAIAAEVAARPAAEAATPPHGTPAQSNVVDLAAARRRRNKRIGWATGLVAAAAAIVAVGTVLVPNLNQQQGTPQAEAPQPAPGNSRPLALTGDNLKQSAPQALGVHDAGPLSDTNKLAGCLAANKAGGPSSVAGIRQLTLDGRPGVLMLLTTGKVAQFRLLVVSPDCSAGHPAMLSDSTIGSTVTPPTK